MSLAEAKRRIAHVKENKLTELDLSECHLTELPEKELIEIGPQLISLNLAYNTIGEKGARFIADYCKNLQSLALSDNHPDRYKSGYSRKWWESGNLIGDLGAKAIAGIVNLTQLKIGSNNLSEGGAKAIAGLVYLKELEISYNGLGEGGAKAIAGLVNLRQLSIRSNSLGEGGVKAIARLVNLTQLNISSNNLGEGGAKAIAGLVNLTQLSIRSNSLGEGGTKAISGLVNLTQLDISDNSLGKGGAKAIAGLVHLTQLDISENSLWEGGAKAIAELVNLTRLDISFNSLGEGGAKAIAGLVNLTLLYISSNSLGEGGAKAIAGLVNLTQLYISANSLGEGGAKAIAGLVNLTQLHISYNSLGDGGAKAIAGLVNLTRLDISFNSLGDGGAKAIAELVNLTELDIRANKLGDEGLKTLAFSKNLIKTYVHLRGNNPQSVPKEIAENIGSLRSYLSAGEETNFVDGNAVRIVLCGNTRAGKTSLATKLDNIKTKNPAEDDRTHGIKHWPLIKEINGKNYAMNIWDFGGQDYYHATHAACLSSTDKERDNKNTLYLLLWRTLKPPEIKNNIRDGNQQLQEDYWLGFVQLLAGRPSLDIIQTHIDDAGNAMAFPVSVLKDRFFELGPANYHYLSLHDDHINEGEYREYWSRFEKYLYGKIEKITHDDKEKIPETWKQIRETELPVLMAANTLASKSDLEKLLLESEVMNQWPDKDEALGFTGLLAYLKGTGDILFWDDDEALKEQVVLHVQRFHEDIYEKILTDKVVKEKRGLFKYNPQYQFHIDYLLRNDLIFKNHKIKNTYVAPQYLPAEPLISHFRELIPLTLVLRYPYYMPRYLITRCIVKVYNQNPETDYWKYGCISAWKNGDAKTKFMVAINTDNNKQEVTFYIQDTKDKYALLRKLFGFFSSFGATDIWEKDEISDRENRISERKERQTGIPDEITDELQLSTDGERFVRFKEIKQAKNDNQYTVKTIESHYIPLNTIMMQLADPKAKTPKKIFFSYSRYERQYREELQVHFAVLKRRGLIETWYDGELDAGEDANARILKELEKADIILCLLSPNFMANDYIWNIEMTKAKNANKIIVPITLVSCDYKKYFAEFLGMDVQGYLTQKQVDRDGLEPTKKEDIIWIASEQHAPKRAEYYTNIVKQLEKIIERD